MPNFHKRIKSFKNYNRKRLKDFLYPQQKISRFELLTRRFFRYLIPSVYKPKYNIRPDWLENVTGKNLEIDIFYPKLRFGVEVNGILHRISWSQKERDITKNELCDKQGIFLLTITHPAQLLKEDILQKIEDFAFLKLEISKLPYSFIRELKRYKGVKSKQMGRVISEAKKERKNIGYKELQAQERAFCLAKMERRLAK